MEIFIANAEDAREFTPYEPTYAIRIFSSNMGNSVRDLRDSKLYLKIMTYNFDDNQKTPPVDVGPKWFDENIAKSIVEDFEPFRNEVEWLLVHCSRGRNRSPAVAMCLNEVFQLGHDTKEMMAMYPAYNTWVYETMLKFKK